MAGSVLVLLSLYVFDWVVTESSGRGLSLRDMRAEAPTGDDWELFGGLALAYIDFLGLLLVLGVALSALVATWPSPTGRRRGGSRVMAVLVVLIAAGVHWLVFVSVINTFDFGFSAAAGTWVGLVGYACVLAGAIVGPARLSQPSGPSTP